MVSVHKCINFECSMVVQWVVLSPHRLMVPGLRGVSVNVNLTR